jgi:hypothetical protein
MSHEVRKISKYVTSFDPCFNYTPLKFHAQAKMESRSALRILIIGRGGRESALAFKLSQSLRVEWIFVVPGNGGTVKEIENISNVAGISEEDFPRLIKLAKDLRIHLVVPSEKQILNSALRFDILTLFRSRFYYCGWYRRALSLWRVIL